MGLGNLKLEFNAKSKLILKTQTMDFKLNHAIPNTKPNPISNPRLLTDP
jgi:hypothetical protein